MSDPTTSAYDDDLDDDTPDHQVTLSRKDIRALEKKGKGYDAVAEENARLKRDLIFAQAGIDTGSDAGKIFARGYDGDLDPDKVREAAQAFNLGQPATPVASDPDAKDGPDLLEGEDKLTSERHELGNQAPRDEGVNPDPYSESMRLGTEVITGGGRMEEGIGTAINYLAQAAHNGDGRVIVDRRSPAGRDQ